MMQNARRTLTVLGLTRFLGALALLAVGAVHLQQYIGADYSSIPTIGPLFLLNAIGAGVVGILLLLPFDRKLAHRPANASVALLALAGVAIAVGALAALFISESTSLFGFSENGYRAAVVAAIAAEAATVLLLGPVAVAGLRRLFGERPSTPSRAAWTARSRHPQAG